MAYEVVMLYHLHMPSYFLGHLLDIPNYSIFHDELDLLSQFTIADKVILNKPMTIIGESGDIGQLQWYGILFYTDYPLCPIPCLLCTSIA